MSIFENRRWEGEVSIRKAQSSLSEDIYVLQSAQWIRIVEFLLIKEEENVFTIKPDAQNECFVEADLAAVCSSLYNHVSFSDGTE